MATGRTWAQVAHKKTPPALPTECAVNLEQYAAPQRLPPSSSRHSAFVPLPVTFQLNWMLDTLASLPTSTVGVVPRSDISLLEVCFANKEAQQDFLSSPLTTTHFTAQPLPPAGVTPQYIPVKLVNVPILSTLIIDHQIRSLWSKYGEVVALAPHTVKGLPLTTNRWDMVIKLPSVGNSLSATPFFDLLGFKVLAAWPGSDKACPRCKEVGHDSRACPKRPASNKRSIKKASSAPPPPPTPSSSLSAADTAPRGASVITQATTSDAAVIDTPVSDPIIPISTDMEIADEDMADASSSASTSVSTPAPTSTPIPTPTTSMKSSSGPTQMNQKDLAYLSPTQLRSLTPAVAPKHIDFEVYMKLSAEQQDAMPAFINLRSLGNPVAPNLRRTRSKDKDKK